MSAGIRRGLTPSLSWPSSLWLIPPVVGLTAAGALAAAGNLWAAVFDFVMAACTLMLARLLVSRSDAHFGFRLAVGSLTLRWALVTIIQLALAAKGHKPLLTSDEFGYDRYAIELSRHWLGTGPAVPAADHYLGGAFSTVLAGAYTLGGYTPFAGLTIPIAFGTWTPVIVHRFMADDLRVDRVTARTAGVLASVYPTTLIWSCLLLKDSGITFATVGLTVAIIALTRRRPMSLTFAKWLVFGAASTAWLAIERPVQLIPIGLGVIVWLAWSSRMHPARLVAGLAICAVCISGAIAASPSARHRISDLPRTLAEHRSLGRIRARTAEAPEGDPAHATLLSTVEHVPAGLALVLVRPTPAEVRGLSELGGVLGNLLNVILVGLAIVGGAVVWRMGRQGPVLLIGTSVVALWFILALVEGNAGTAWRHRDPVTPLLVALAGIALTQPKMRTRYISITRRMLQLLRPRSVA